MTKTIATAERGLTHYLIFKSWDGKLYMTLTIRVPSLGADYTDKITIPVETDDIEAEINKLKNQ